MPTFLVEFADPESGESKGIEFEAETPAPAFTIVEKEGAPCHVKVWRGSSFLGDIHRDRKGIWHFKDEAGLGHSE